jgi:hypothetical protein
MDLMILYARLPCRIREVGSKIEIISIGSSLAGELYIFTEDFHVFFVKCLKSKPLPLASTTFLISCT